jgi:hypothetical protein
VEVVVDLLRLWLPICVLPHCELTQDEVFVNQLHSVVSYELSRLMEEYLDMEFKPWRPVWTRLVLLPKLLMMRNYYSELSHDMIQKMLKVIRKLTLENMKTFLRTH